MKTLTLLSLLWIALLSSTGCCPKSKYEICVTACEAKVDAAIAAKQACDDQALEELQHAMQACWEISRGDPEAYRTCVELARTAYSNKLNECENTYNESRGTLIGCSQRCFSRDSQSETESTK